MNEQAVHEKLNLLFELGITLAELNEEMTQMIAAAIPQEVKERSRRSRQNSPTKSI